MLKEAIVTINDINMYERYRALMAEAYSVQPPAVKTAYKDVPGADGTVDLSTALSGRPIYERREITMKFSCAHHGENWPGVLSEILQNFHGKEGKIVFGDDPMYYYNGRMSVSDYERKSGVARFTITANADPYKYELRSSLEDWLWDELNFETGIIREYGNIKVEGTYTLMVYGTERWTIPELTVSGQVSVTFEKKTYELKEGTTKIYGIVIKNGENQLVFSGNGTVSVNYRGGVL